jgi:hypothetical protein
MNDLISSGWARGVSHPTRTSSRCASVAWRLTSNRGESALPDVPLSSRPVGLIIILGNGEPMAGGKIFGISEKFSLALRLARLVGSSSMGSCCYTDIPPRLSPLASGEALSGPERLRRWARAVTLISSSMNDLTSSGWARGVSHPTRTSSRCASVAWRLTSNRGESALPDVPLSSRPVGLIIILVSLWRKFFWNF